MCFQEGCTGINVFNIPIDVFKSGLVFACRSPLLNSLSANYYILFYQYVMGLIQRHWGGASLDSLRVKEVVGKFPQEMPRMVESSQKEKRAKMVGGVLYSV